MEYLLMICHDDTFNPPDTVEPETVAWVAETERRGVRKSGDRLRPAKIRNAGIPCRVPPRPLLAERIGGVLGVLYLLFNEGYAAIAHASLIRQELTGEAIRLARLLTPPDAVRTRSARAACARAAPRRTAPRPHR